MKKIVFITVCVSLIFNDCLFLINQNFACAKEPINNNSIIKDELLEHISKNIKPFRSETNTEIIDELIEPEHYDSSLFKLRAVKNKKIENIDIEDELITKDFILNNATGGKVTQKPTRIDDFIIKKVDLTKAKIIKPKTCYDFTKKIVPVTIKIANKISPKHIFLEGDTIDFKTTGDVEINKKSYPKGTAVVGRIETLSKSDKMGTPESLKIDNFYIDGKPKINLSGSISKTGANRSIWVYPLYQAGNIMFFVAGFVFVPIHGGHVKLSLNETYTLFYETK